jgi:hypothetical protein
LTEQVKPAILEGSSGWRTQGLHYDSDGALSWHYEKKGRWFRDVLFKVDGTQAIYRDPTTKQDFVIGRVVEIDGGPLIVVYLI